MRILKITIFAAVATTIVILFGIGYVWRELAFTAHTVVPAEATETVATTSALELSASTTALAPVPLSEPITVTAGDLPDAQRAVLETLGMGDASITITPEMVRCAIDSLGAVRVGEIQKGDAPSLAEGLTLIACMKK